MIIKKDDQIVHTGVPGMKWGVRRGSKEQVGLIPRMLGRKSNFRIGKKKGQSDADFDKEYAKEIGSSIPKAKTKTKQALNLIGSKKLSYSEREQKRRTVTKNLVKSAMRVISGLLILDIASGIRVGKPRGMSDAEFDREYQKEISGGD